MKIIEIQNCYRHSRKRISGLKWMDEDLFYVDYKKIDQLLKSEKDLVFRFSISMCDKCIEEEKRQNI